jgi:acetyl esterase/lipase
MTTQPREHVLAAPPFDAELAPALDALAEAMPPTLTAELVKKMAAAQAAPPIDTLVGRRPVVHTERRIAGPPGAPEVVLSIFARADQRTGGPGIFHSHGGGLVMGTRFTGLTRALPWVEELDAVLVSVEYRLAPENPYPAALEDCYRGLVWAVAHAGELGFDPARLMLAGASAGGGLAASLALRARDENGPRLAGQILMSPMLDDRNATWSSRQVDGIGVWDRHSNDLAWNAYLGPVRARSEVPAYAAPARATDLAGLPPAFIDVGSVEVFRDEAVAYATGIWAAAGSAELHVWPGAFHSFDLVAPDAAVSLAAQQARLDWLRRSIGR